MRNLWKEIKEKYDLDSSYVLKAKKLGLNPKDLLTYEERWNESVKEFIDKVYYETVEDENLPLNNSKLNKIIKINKMLIYLALGIIILIFRDDLLDYLYLIVSLPLLIIATEELAYEIYEKAYMKKANIIGSCVVRIILSIIILFLDQELFLICIIWGIIVILSATIMLDNAVYLITNKKYIIFFIELAQSIAQIVFATLLIIDPAEHISFHIILLGIEMELIAFRIFMEFTYTYIHNKFYKKEVSAS